MSRVHALRQIALRIDERAETVDYYRAVELREQAGEVRAAADEIVQLESERDALRAELGRAVAALGAVLDLHDRVRAS